MEQYNNYEKAANKPRIDFSSLMASGNDESTVAKPSNQPTEEALPEVPTQWSVETKEQEAKENTSAQPIESLIVKNEKIEGALYEKRKGILRKQAKVRKYLPEREGKRITPTLPMATVQKAKILSLLIQENRDNCNDPGFDRSATRRCDMTGIANAFFDVCLHLLGDQFHENLPSNILNEVQLRDYILRKAREKYKNIN